MQDPHAGELRTRVAIREWQDVPAGMADVIQEFGAPAYRWAKVAPVSGAVFWGSQQTDTGVTHRISLRFYAQANSRLVIEADGVRYRVKRFWHSPGAKRWTHLECEALGHVSR